MTSEHYAAEIISIIRKAEEAAYRRGYEEGQADKAAEIMKVLNAIPEIATDHDESASTPSPSEGKKITDTTDIEGRKRAPRGLVPKFISRVLTETPGLTPKEILESAQSDYERMIKPASIRSELRKPMYESRDGRWYLVSVEAEGKSHEDEPSASENNSKGGSDAAALI
jgi:hypothetical protein